MACTGCLTTLFMVSDDIFSIGGKDYGPSPKMQGSWMGQISPSKPRAPTNPWTDLVTNGIGILECFSDGRCPEVDVCHGPRCHCAQRSDLKQHVRMIPVI